MALIGTDFSARGIIGITGFGIGGNDFVQLCPSDIEGLENGID